MDKRGSTVMTVSHRAHSKMKELSAKLQEKKEDCLPEGFVFELPNAVYSKFPEIKRIKELKAIWESWTVER